MTKKTNIRVNKTKASNSKAKNKSFLNLCKSISSLTLVFGLTTACGDGIDYDAINGIPTENVPSTQTPSTETTGPLSLTVVSPLADSIEASPLDEIFLKANHPIDAKSISSTTIWLAERESKRVVSAEVRIENGTDLIITPNQPLTTGARYTVHVDGVSAAGDETPFSMTSKFRVLNHLQTLSTYFVDGNTTQYYQSDFDTENGVYSVKVFRVGLDGKPNTADDHHAHLTEYVYNADGDIVETIVRANAGQDDTFSTDDDEFLYRRISNYDGRGLLSTYQQWAGADKKLDTADDYQDSIVEYSYDENDALTRHCGKTSGEDKLAFTDDDITNRCTTYVVGDNEKLTFSYNGAGEDGMFGTDDDVLSSWTRQTLNANGAALSYARYSPSEGEMVDSNEFRVANTLLEYDENGLIISSFASSGPGEDEVWGTSDDRDSNRSVRTYDSNGFITSLKSINAGDDNISQTDDDETHTIVRW